MSSKLRLTRLLICCFPFLPAVAQLDSAALHTKFGAPLNRETFHLPAGFDLVVDYGSNSQVCQFHVPALMPTTEQVARAAAMKQRMYDFLTQLVPDAMRGKELERGVLMMGMVSFSFVEYEHVTVSEREYANQPFSNENTITVTFKGDSCPNLTNQ